MLSRLGGKDNLFSSLVIAHPAPPALKDIEAIKVSARVFIKKECVLIFVAGTYSMECRRRG